MLENQEFSQADYNWMKLALKLAKRGQGKVEPNPMVGCVITQAGDSDDKLIGQGWHRKFGDRHAEIEAIESCQGKSIEGATVYVTLEPCCHQGKTGPCSKALIDAKVGRLVIACRDPYGPVDGKGIDEIKEAGIQVDIGLCEAEASRILAPYFKRITKKQPWVIAKWAMTLDGKIATRTGDSQWISNKKSREIVHDLRSRVDAILVGNNTVAVDDPALTARPADGSHRNPLRVVIDRELKTDLDSQLVTSSNETPTLFFAGRLVDHSRKAEFEKAGCEVFLSSEPSPWGKLDELLLKLYEKEVTNLLVEGGGQTIGTFFDQRMLDEFHVFISTRICGGEKAVSPILGKGMPTISHCLSLEHVQRELVGDDIYVRGFSK